MSHKGINFLCNNTPLNAYMLEVAQAVRDDVAEASVSANYENADQSDHSEHSASVHTPTPPIASPQPDDLSERTASVSVSREKPISAKDTSLQSTSPLGTASEHTPVPSPNDYTSKGGFQTPEADEGVLGPLDNYALNREFWRMKKVVDNQVAEIKRLRHKFRRLKRFVWPLVKNFRLYVKEMKQSQKKKSKSTKKVSKSKRSHKKSSSFKLGRNQDDNLNEDDAGVQYSEDAHLWHYPEEPLNFVP
jgi:Sec-independent protein translocase protein TatA